MTKVAMNSWTRTLAVAAAAALLAACAGSGRRSSGSQSAASGQDKAGEAEAAYTPGVEVTEASLRGAEFAQSDALQDVRFEYDSSALKGDALETLKKNAAFLKARPQVEVLVAGHCDERGTVEYNLALGQRRAREVREYYMRLGVPGKSMATISYGEESPLCGESAEECWSRNRRAETRVRDRIAGDAKPPAR